MGRIATQNPKFFVRLKYAPRKTGECYAYRPSTISQVPGLKEGDAMQILELPKDKESKTVIVKKKADWLRALAYPMYKGGFMYPPPVCFLFLGQVYATLPLRVLVTAVDVAYQAPWSPESHLPHGAQVELSMVCVSDGKNFQLPSSSHILRRMF